MEFMTDTTTWLLACTALLAGLIDAIAGGGGLITIPALLLTGMAPVTVLGTNKLQSLFGSLSATIAYISAGHVELKGQFAQALLACLGGIAGALVATLLACSHASGIAAGIAGACRPLFCFQAQSGRS